MKLEWRQIMNVGVDLVGSTVSFIEGQIFLKIPQGTLPSNLFPPLGGGLAGYFVAAPFLENNKLSKTLKALGIVTSAAVNLDIYCYHGTTSAAIFTGVTAVNASIFSLDFLYKIYTKEIKKDYRGAALELSILLSKLAGIILVLNLDGTGKIINLVISGTELPLKHKIASYVTSGLAHLCGAFGLYRTAKRVKEEIQEQPVKEENLAHLSAAANCNNC